ncbi:two-component response regulator ARR14-like [Phoenix dactylifera]|uniref:Two-component response regulator ARR14-like n=1 Tax=Phoenix dactylifera TaxID=42345 RepID=A0A8B8JAK6_PHODC|nr:two-component response regulator ARR14-like [Phoenix dactylifera]XP_026664789.2 two-component response regulator ARR14-like [Phoenix dactylifera]
MEDNGKRKSLRPPSRDSRRPKKSRPPESPSVRGFLRSKSDSWLQAMVAESSNGGQSQFPFGLRVLVVDDDIISLRTVEFLLLRCGYLVTATLNALTALKLLRENRDNYDLVISDVRMPEMDGFGLLEAIRLEMDVPVIMLSADGEVNTVLKGIAYGAVDYLVKPVRLEELRLIWKHVVKKSLHGTKGAHSLGDRNNHEMALEDDLEEEFDDNHEIELEDNHDRELEAGHEQELEDGHTTKVMRKGRERERCSDGSSTQKKPRFVWSLEMHALFLKAVHHLGIDRAVPRKIQDLMNVSGLTRENIASHLQKYRLALKKNGIRMDLQYYGGLGPIGYGGSHPSSLLLPFNQQLDSNVSTLGGLKVACLPPSMNNPDSVHQQFTANPQAGQLRMQQFGYASNPDVVGTSNTQSGFQFPAYHNLPASPNQVDGHMQNSFHNPCSSSGNPGPNSGPQPGLLSNPSMMGTSNAPSGFNSLSCQFLTSPDQVDGSVQNSSYNPCATSGHPGPSSGFQPGCSSNDYHDILENITVAELNAILPMQYEQNKFVDHTGAVMGMQVSGDSVDLQSCPDGEKFKEISNPELTKHLSEHSPSETEFDMDKCDFMDDIDTFFKQFQQ